MIEKTLFVIKPDGVKRKLVGEIIKRIENSGLRVAAMKIVKVDKKLAGKHYATTESQIVGMGKKTIKASMENEVYEEVKNIFGTENPRKMGLILRKWMIDFLISGPVVAMVVEGENAIKRIREISGYTDPSKAEKGTIRGDLSKDSIVNSNRERRATENLVHASGSKEEAEKEIRLWFNKKEIFKQ
jgi:nucleoside-diphosphate kinase